MQAVYRCMHNAAASSLTGNNCWGPFSVALVRHGHVQAQQAPDKKEVIAMIRELRARSGAPMGDVKTALEEVQYDMDRAYEALRRKGVAAAAKKATRTAAQGLVAIASSPGCAAIVEVNSETDFVARSDVFASLMPSIARAALHLPGAVDSGSQAVAIPDLAASRLASAETSTVGEALTDVAAKVRENVQLRRASRLFSPGYIATYVHNAVGPDAGLVAAAVAFESPSGPLSEAAVAELQTAGKHIAMQVVAMSPVSVTREGVPVAMLEKERDILTEVARKEGKPEKFVAKMVEGRLGKFFEENVLLDQRFILDDKATVRQVLRDVSKRAGVDVTVTGFIQMKVGAGLEQAE